MREMFRGANMGIRFVAVLLGAALLMSLALITTSCNKPAQDSGPGASASGKPATVTAAASSGLPKLQEYGADW
jgi:hypothetical protein